MMATITHSDSQTLIWSPNRDKMAYITAQGLQVYISDGHHDEEEYMLLSSQSFVELNWSPEGKYLAARSAGGWWHVFRFDQMGVWRVFRAEASSMEWLDDHQVLYVPENGGLMLLDMRDIPHPIKLAG